MHYRGATTWPQPPYLYSVLARTGPLGSQPTRQQFCRALAGERRRPAQVYGSLFQSRKAEASLPFPSPDHRNTRRFSLA